MSEPMQVWVELWPLAADNSGIWLLSGADAWRPLVSVAADTEPHSEIELLLAEHGAFTTTALLHSTSWRVDGPALVLTYVAVIKTDDLVRSSWPTALPVSSAVTEAVGPAPTHGPAEPPTPRYIDVLRHAIRHLAFLREHDATAAAALPAPWPAHLAQIRPAIAGMYSVTHQPL
jgi:hypothetical protein